MVELKLVSIVTISIASLFSTFSEARAQAWRYCLERANSLGLVATQAERIVSDISVSMSIRREVHVIGCDELEEGKLAEVPSSNESGIDLIAIDTSALSLVLNRDTIEEAHFLVAHELGHILNGDWGRSRAQYPRKKLEEDADIFATCAVARLGGDWRNLERFLSRLRSKDSLLIVTEN